jgi:REP-associated tyrosine transposase
MSKARPVYPGAVLFSTRRVHKRQLLLRPSPRLNQAIQYIIAVLAKRHGIRLHAFCAMGNHTHDVASDPDGRIVEFQRDCHAIMARVINAMHGDFESLWSREPTCRVECVEPDDALDKIAYTMANPVSAGLVAHGHSWPGVRGAWPMKPRTVKRPPGFFRDEDSGGQWPEEATLEFHPPPCTDAASEVELAALVRRAIDECEAKARAKVKAAKKNFLGRAAVLRQSRYAYPVTSEDRFGLRPTVACRSKWARIERLQRNRDWLELYNAAMKRVLAGETNVIFPFGTWKMRVYCGHACGPPPVPPAVCFAA